MPNLSEDQGIELLSEAGINVPEHEVASTPKEAAQKAKRFRKARGAMVVKALIGTTGRFKAGGIKFARNADEVEEIAEELLGKYIKGFKVERVLVEEKVEGIEKELYVGIIVDDSYKVKGPVLIFSTEGGVDVEKIAEGKKARTQIDILGGLTVQKAAELIKKLDTSVELVEPLSQVLVNLYTVWRKYDCRTAEINPLVKTKDGKIYAVDCKLVIDGASLFKHPELGLKYPRDIGREPTELERIAWEIEREDYRGTGFFIQLARDFEPGEGYIGFQGIGGGAAMLGAHALARQGLKPANYADTSGNPTASKVYRIIKLIFSQPNIDGYILIGAVMANQEQWHHAHAIVKALREELKDRPNFPVIILIAGNKEKESLNILRNGLKGLPAKIEIYGRDYVYEVDHLAQRMKTMVQEYRRNGNKNGSQ